MSQATVTIPDVGLDKPSYLGDTQGKGPSAR